MEKDITEEVEYVYITIPKEYVCIYTKILILFVDFGIDMLNDCKASCNDKIIKIKLLGSKKIVQIHKFGVK